jgi:parallel beta-helix repeat protein
MERVSRCFWFATAVFTLVALGPILGAANNQLFAATLCVNPSGTGGCYSTINAAVAAASPGDTITVAGGTYKEDVVIGKALSLIGNGRAITFIYATGLSNGIYIDGLDNAGLSGVEVTGFTVENANFEGILVTNASNVTIWSNRVTQNDKALDPNVPVCTGQTTAAPFETDEAFDCGGGLHIMGVDHSTITGNIADNNADGILISDDTGPTHNNLIMSNVVRQNPFDCGIVLASHPPAPGSSAAHNGIYENTLSNNESTHNGYQVPGAGAGIGMFSDGTGVGRVSGNVITNNDLKKNGLPGVAMHSHVGPNFGLPPDNLNDNVIVGNRISGNGPDLFDTATPGPTGINVNSGGGGTPITGTVISGNIIENEDVDVAANTPGAVQLHLNNLLGEKLGVDNLGTGTIDATENWWGCSHGPAAPGCSSAGGVVSFTPWLRRPIPGDSE